MGRGQSDIIASGTSDELNRSVENGITQASVMWLLHRMAVVQHRDESLEQHIVKFSSAVFDAIGSSYPKLRNAGRERLWLIYFKGLLTAQTHPLEDMLQAFRNIASTHFGASPLLPEEKVPLKADLGHVVDDADALKQIARGLHQDK